MENMEKKECLEALAELKKYIDYLDEIIQELDGCRIVQQLNWDIKREPELYCMKMNVVPISIGPLANWFPAWTKLADPEQNKVIRGEQQKQFYGAMYKVIYENGGVEYFTLENASPSRTTDELGRKLLNPGAYKGIYNASDLGKYNNDGLECWMEDAVKKYGFFPLRIVHQPERFSEYGITKEGTYPCRPEALNEQEFRQLKAGLSGD